MCRLANRFYRGAREPIAIAALSCVLLASAACDRGPAPGAATDAPPPQGAPAVAGAAAPGPGETPAEPALAPPVDPIVAESSTWTREDAAAKLADDKLAVSAAVRLVRLSSVGHDEWPDPLPIETTLRLRVVRLSDELFGVGAIVDGREATLGPPLALLSAAGEREKLPWTERAWTLHVSHDADIFPHLLVSPRRVVNLANRDKAALVLKRPEGPFFSLRFREGYPYLALCLRPGADVVELAEYRWDPYELLFAGPAIDKLPDPPGGKYELDLKLSSGLTPLGGEVPPPRSLEKPEEDEDLPPPY
ncbi:MAG: hypothetical protein AB7Q17_02560 [Phycisphaerae bacterium]